MTIVPPAEAVAAMAAHWRKLGNATSPALERTWHDMCQAYNRAGCEDTGADWTALAMPTGTGKTQFTALYCSLLQSSLPRGGSLPPVLSHPGLLFVTRFRDEADRFVSDVNEHASEPIAAAFHGNAPLKLADARRCPVLAITHQATVQYQLGPYSEGSVCFGVQF